MAALVIVSCGVLLRLAYNSETFFIEPVRGDAANYFQYAINLVDHNTFSKDSGETPTPDAYWTPGYPIFLALNFKLSDHLDIKAYDLVMHSQVALAACSIWLLFLLGRLLLPSYWPVLPATLLAFSPHHVSLGSYALTETLFGFTLLATIYCLAKALERQQSGYYLASGTALAASYMVNPVSVVIVPAIALGLWLFRTSIRTENGVLMGHRHAVLLMLPLVLAASLWSVRSAVTVPADQSGSGDRLLANLTVGLYPDYHEKWKASVLDPEAGIVVPGAGVAESLDTFFRELVLRFSDAPVEMLSWFAFGKPYQLWQWDILTGQGDIYVYDILYSLYHISTPALVSYSIMHALHPWLLVCSLLGALLVIARKTDLADLTVPVIAYSTLFAVSAVYIITQAEPRYSVPLRPELYLTAMFFVWQACEYLKRLRKRSLERHNAAKSAVSASAAE